MCGGFFLFKRLQRLGKFKVLLYKKRPLPILREGVWGGGSLIPIFVGRNHGRYLWQNAAADAYLTLDAFVERDEGLG